MQVEMLQVRMAGDDYTFLRCRNSTRPDYTQVTHSYNMIMS